MKKLFFIAIIGLISICGCSGNTPVNELDIDDFVGNWFMQGTLDLNLDGRWYIEEVAHTVYIREGGFVTDELGNIYAAKFENLTLTLSRGSVFQGHDPYCGFYDGGTTLTFEMPAINPFFNHPYEGTASGETAVYTQYCNYKPMIISGTVIMQRI